MRAEGPMYSPAAPANHGSACGTSLQNESGAAVKRGDYKWQRSSQLHVISTRHPTVPASRVDLRRFLFSLWFFCHFPGPSPNPIYLSHLPPTDYSFKVVFRVFRVFRVFHSVPVQTQLCSSWNIQHNVPVGTLSSFASPTDPEPPGLLRCAAQGRRWYRPWQLFR